jgi:anaerobic selenocysteine-containing dehydrogenase
LADLWAEIERVSPLHQGVSQALLVSRQARNGIVVPIGPRSAKEEANEAPAPLDPMADPGIASAQLHPLPPVPAWQASLGAVDGFTAPAAAPAVGPPTRLTPRAPTAAGTAGTPGSGATGTGTENSEGQGPQTSLRLVASRPMWDGGAFVQFSPSLAQLHPALELRVNPGDLARLGVENGSFVRVSAGTGRAGVVATAVADAAVRDGTAVLPFNLPGGGAGNLIDALAPHTEITLGPVE